MIKRTFGCVVVCGCLMAGGSLQAHHSLSAVYEIRQTAELTGVISKVEFMNPHGAMTVEVENEDGSKTEWVMTTGSANVLSSLGFRSRRNEYRLCRGCGHNHVLSGEKRKSVGVY